MFAWGGCGIITVSFVGRMLLDDGTIQTFRHQVVIQNDNVIVAKTVQPGPGTLIDFTVSVPQNTTNEGALYGEAWLGTLQGSTFFPHRQVVWGRVIGRLPLSAFADPGTRPEPQSQRSLLGQEVVAPGDLAYNVFVNGGVRRELTSIRFRCDTSAVVAIRRVFVYVTAFSGFELWRWYDPNTMLASQRVEFSLSNFSAYSTVTDSAGVIHRSDKLPQRGIFQSPFFINVVLDNRQAGDAFSIFDFWTEEI